MPPVQPHMRKLTSPTTLDGIKMETYLPTSGWKYCCGEDKRLFSLLLDIQHQTLYKEYKEINYLTYEISSPGVW